VEFSGSFDLHFVYGQECWIFHGDCIKHVDCFWYAFQYEDLT
jgi:hypothetical protein